MWNSGLTEVILSLNIDAPFLTHLHDQSSHFHFHHIKPEEFSSIPPEHWAKTEILITEHALPEPNKAPNLKWIQFWGTYSLDEINQYKKTSPLTIFTSSEGVATYEKTSFCLHHLTDFFTNNILYGSTVGIIGYGSIGREIARVLKTFDCTILAATFDAMNPNTSTFQPEGTGDLSGTEFDRLYPIQALPSMLQQCSFIINTPLLSNLSKDLIDETIFATLNPDTVFIDVSHPGVTSTKKTTSILKENNIRYIQYTGEIAPNEQPDHSINFFLELLRINLIRFTNHQTLLNTII
jgi:phosphoglycerate dehydrogenase-like enzyme